MELWFREKHTKNVHFSIKMNKQIYSEQTPYNRIDIFESLDFGRCLMLDGSLMSTEKDEFIYHEMMVHVPLAVHPEIKKVLVIGVGDGGSIRELCKYSSIERIDLVEIDKTLVEAIKTHLPNSSSAFNDPRVNVIISDGLKYVRKCENAYGLIIVDSPDPYGPAEALFTKEFYGNCYKALCPRGIMVNQHENPFYEKDLQAMQKVHKNIHRTFDVCKVFQAHIPTYPSGHWLFGFASKKYHPIRDLKIEDWKKFNIKANYYNTLLHQGAFYLPNFVTELLKDVE